MINFEVLEKCASDLNGQDNSSIVVTAGVIRRLYNWFKQLSSEEYRQQVSNLRNESASVKSYMDNLSAQLERMNQAIKDADVDDYEAALEEVKYLSGELLSSLNSLKNIAQQSEVIPDKRETKREIKPDTKQEIENKQEVIEHGVPGVKREYGRVNIPLRKLEGAQGLNVNISDKAKQKVFEYLDKIPLKETDKDLEGQEYENFKGQFIIALSEAIKNGMVEQVYPVRKEKRAYQNYLTVKTPPFSVPKSKLKFISTVLLNEVPNVKLSVMRILNINHEFIKGAGYVKQAAQVNKQFSSIDQVEFAKVLIKAYYSVFGRLPNIQAAASMWAQGTLESGRRGGTVNLVNNNIGGLTAGNSWIKSGKPYILASTGLKFKVFESPLEGAKEYINTLARMYPDSLKWKSAGMPFDDALYMAGKNYYGKVPIKSYGGTMDNLFYEYIQTIYPKLGIKLSEEPTEPPSEVSNQYKLYGDNPSLSQEEKSKNILLDKPELKSQKYSWKQQAPKEDSVDASIDNEERAIDNESKALMNYLYSNKLETLVKKAILNKELPPVSLNIKLEADSVCEKAKYALSLTELLDNIIKGSSEIVEGKEGVEVIFKSFGDEVLLINAVLHVGRILSEKMLKKYNCAVDISDISLNKKISSGLDYNKLYKYERQFHLSKLGTNNA